MTNSILNFLAIACYLALAAGITARLLRGQTANGAARHALIGIGIVAVTVHALAIFAGPSPGTTLNLSFAGALSLVAWVVVCLYLLVSFWRPIDNLGVFITPVAALAVFVEWLRPTPLLIPLTSQAQAIHVVVALVAYSLLCLAALQSIMLLAQHRQLRHKHTGGFLRALPSIQTMEDIMFQMIALGFLLLTVTLISGVLFSESMFGTPLKITHHILFAVLGWIVYAGLLVGHWRFGWRGRTAVRWTLGGFGLLILAYFGTKFVAEILLGR